MWHVVLIRLNCGAEKNIHWLMTFVLGDKLAGVTLALQLVNLGRQRTWPGGHLGSSRRSRSATPRPKPVAQLGLPASPWPSSWERVGEKGAHWRGRGNSHPAPQAFPYGQPRPTPERQTDLLETERPRFQPQPQPQPRPQASPWLERCTLHIEGNKTNKRKEKKKEGKEPIHSGKLKLG